MTRLEKTTDLIVFSLLRDKGYVDGEFKPLLDGVHVWAQTSTHPEICKLLSGASKNKTGQPGYPEYIVFDETNDIVVVIENKKDTRKHFHKSISAKARDYAVNGALWYASFIKTGFDVIAISVSGSSAEELRVDTFAWRKGAEAFTNLNLYDLLPAQGYADLLNRSRTPRGFRESTLKLQAEAKKINEFLRDMLGVIEHDRLYVLGAVLYALEDPVFRMSYTHANSSRDLSTMVFQTVERKVRGSQLAHKSVIVDELRPVLQGAGENEPKEVQRLYPNGAFLELVGIVDNVLFEYHRNSELDLISTFFNVFLSYSTAGGSDLGIALTPTHITQLFCDLAAVDGDSRVLDICAGTGGFLTADWKRIALNSSIEPSKKQAFRENNIYGIEKERSLYTIIAINMFINKDGRSNLMYGDAFSLADSIKELECNIGLLNPPFSDGVYPELRFVELMLDCLLPASTGVAVLPVNAVSKRTKKHRNITAIKERVLKKNKLLASIQLPGNLFYPKGTETIALVFETGTAHEGETWLARYDDGYELIKHRKTRTPSARSRISHDELIAAYKQRASTDFSFTKEMSAEDQWVYTLHVDDHYMIEPRDLQSTVNEFIGYLHLNNYR